MKFTDINSEDIENITFITGEKDSYFSFDLLFKNNSYEEIDNFFFSGYMTNGHHEILDQINDIENNCKIRLYFGDSTINSYSLDYHPNKLFKKDFKTLVSKLNDINKSDNNLIVYYNPSNHSKFLRINNDNIFSSQNYGANHYFSIENGTHIKFNNTRKLDEYYNAFENTFLDNEDTLILFGIKNLFTKYLNKDIKELLDIFSIFSNIENDINAVIYDIENGIEDLSFNFNADEWEKKICKIEDSLSNDLIDTGDEFIFGLNELKNKIIHQREISKKYLTSGLQFSDEGYIEKINNYIDYFDILIGGSYKIKEIIIHSDILDVYNKLSEIDYDYLFLNWKSNGEIIGSYNDEIEELNNEYLSIEENHFFDYTKESDYIEKKNKIDSTYSNFDLNDAPTGDDLNDFFKNNIYLEEVEKIRDLIINNEGFASLKEMNEFIKQLDSLNKDIDIDLDILTYIHF